jgi:hypothetical protein
MTDSEDLSDFQPVDTISSKKEKEIFDSFFPKKTIANLITPKDRFNWTLIIIIVVIFMVLTFPLFSTWIRDRVDVDKNVIWIGQIVLFSIGLLATIKLIKR